MSLSLAHRLFKSTISGMEKTLKAISPDLYFKVVAGLFDEINPIYAVPTKKGEIYIKCVSETARIRAKGMLLREPDTLKWIETFNPDDVFWDVGSNIGVYSLYAAVVSEARVVAFDPLPYNYQALIENAVNNNVSERIQAFCVAVSDKTIVAPLFVNSTANTVGGAGCPFGENMDNYGNPTTPEYQFSALGFSLDDFLRTFELPFPNHLKIDIDGIQEKVIIGSHELLRDPRLKTVMIELQPGNIEINQKANTFINSELENAGFTLRKTVGSTPDGTDDPNTSVTNNFFHRS